MIRIEASKNKSKIIKRRGIAVFMVLSGMTLYGRNSYNLTSRWKRVLILIPWYLMSIGFAIMDLFFVGELFTLLLRLTSKNRRGLTQEELDLFASLPLERQYLSGIKVMEKSWLARFGKFFSGRRQLGLGVARTIHFSRAITLQQDKGWLVHEVAHSLQYKYRGLSYIPEALIAQKFSGYSYGGKETLSTAQTLKSFNPEQQADIFKALILFNSESELRREINNGNW